MAKDDEKKKGLLAVFGPPEKERSEESDGGDFESAATDAFPELAGKPERIAALKQAIKACYAEE
jgi:hypothetical protein